MEYVLNSSMINDMTTEGNDIMTLATANVDNEYIIKQIDTDDVEMKDFLFTLGCYAGERITVISNLSENYVINVKEARYSIDIELANAIIV